MLVGCVTYHILLELNPNLTLTLHSGASATYFSLELNPTITLTLVAISATYFEPDPNPNFSGVSACNLLVQGTLYIDPSATYTVYQENKAKLNNPGNRTLATGLHTKVLGTFV